MNNLDIPGSADDLERLGAVQEKRLGIIFNIRGFFLAADVGWLVLVATFMRDIVDEGILAVLLVDASLLFAVLTLICLALSFVKDVRQPGELFIEMFRQLVTSGSLQTGITAASKRWYEECSSKVWPWFFAASIILYLAVTFYMQFKVILAK